MKKYECLYIVNINYDSEGISTVAARIEEILKSIGAEVKNTQHWGKRKLAYAIDKERYGNYILLHFEGENPDIAEFHREVEIESGILHYLTIRLDEFPDFDSLSVPQAFDTERKRPSAPVGRRPRHYDDDDDIDVVEDDDLDDVVLIPASRTLAVEVSDDEDDLEDEPTAADAAE